MTSNLVAVSPKENTMNTIRLSDQVDTILRDVGDRSGTDLARKAMLHAAQRRHQPIFMTAVAAVCGMLPLAFALRAGRRCFYLLL
jgi:multidrug efflux pump subunit AcrB